MKKNKVQLAFRKKSVINSLNSIVLMAEEKDPILETNGQCMVVGICDTILNIPNCLPAEDPGSDPAA